jgi:multidrug efflux pump subunit AcrB
MNDTLTRAEHLTLLRDADEKFQNERDRRYTEVKNAEEKALKIKEEADKNALDLARQIQTYKDEQHNGLLKQHADFVAKAVTQTELTASMEKMEALLKPVNDFMLGQQGGSKGSDKTLNYILMALVAANIIIGIWK